MVHSSGREAAVPQWVAEAAVLPLAFAQVREDPALDQWVVAQLGDGARVIMIASGGCTAAALAGSLPLANLHLLDPNPAQLALARLKLHLLQTTSPAERLALLGHAPMPPAQRAVRLTEALRTLNLPSASLGSVEIWSKLGPDHAGRYERVFARLRERLRDHAGAIEALLRLRDPAEQQRRVDPATDLGRAFDDAFDDAMDLDNLIRLFGEGATRNRVEPFARHFARRTRHALATLPAADNPYLAQVLLGRYMDGVTAPWFDLTAPARMPAVTWQQGFMVDSLREAPAAYDFVHLSNILDWLGAEEAAATLDLAWEALRPSGRVLIRQLNSTLDVPALGSRFTWQENEAAALHARDRSYFYRALHLGRKP
jgi:S-adenosylmethionine-diacylglycerol 3-amino-3-carboxypropyl transferase